MKYIFFGSSEFAKIVLGQLIQNNLKPILIVTQSPKPKGRKQILSPTLVQLIAEQNNIPFLTPENLNDEDFLKTIKNLQPETILLTAYGKIIPSELLKIPPQGFLNLHPSFLPKWRGATPIQSTILAGDTETGVTLFEMDEKIDHGPIIKNQTLNIKNKKYDYFELMEELAQIGSKLLIKIIPQWLEGKITPFSQDESLATYCHKITKEDEKIHWQISAEEVDRKVRALNPNPGTYTMGQERIIKIIKGFPVIDFEQSEKKGSTERSEAGSYNKLSTIKQIGEVFEDEKKMAIKCGKGFYVIEELKPAGKTTMLSENFLMGNRWIIGQVLN